MTNQLIITLTGFIATLAAIVTPLFKLNSSITKLNVTMDNVNKCLAVNEEANKGRDAKLNNHEIRIDRLEHK